MTALDVPSVSAHLPLSAPGRVRHLYLSSGHQFFGRHGLAPAPHPCLEVESLDCVAGRGVRGDRFFDYRHGYKGQVTLFSWEVFEQLVAELQLPHASPAALRRNAIISGLDLNSLIGRRFSLQNVGFEGVEECRPCYWMDAALGPGAEVWLRGRGGLRCRILASGSLHRE